MALVQGFQVDVVQTLIVAASHLSQVSPFSPSGIVKSSTAAEVVPLFTTLADVQG